MGFFFESGIIISKMKKYAKILRVVLVLLIILDVLTGLLWGIVALSIVGLLPFGATIWILVIHIKSFVQLGHQNYISENYIKQQMIAGIVIALCASIILAYISYFLWSFDSTSTHSIYSGNMNAVITGVVAFLLCTPSMYTVLKLNKNARESIGTLSDLPQLSKNEPLYPSLQNHDKL